jgi:vitamin K-dependent gamma-carboxylase
MTERWTRLVERATAPVSPGSLVALRVLFGLLMLAATVRFLASDAVESQYLEPSFHFRYFGFEWVPVPPAETLRLELAAMALLAGLVAAGLLTRLSLAAFLLLFTHVQLADVTNYLNHYYFVVLLGLVLLVLPSHARYSLDARLFPAVRRDAIPLWMVWLPRFQIAVVYVFAAVAKVGTDWLVHGQPVAIWTTSRTDLPVLGPLFALPWVPLAMSWAGFLYDATIVGFLSWRRSRPYAFLLVLAFHSMTHVLFNIGIFPFLMPVATTAFLDPDWPERALARLGVATRATGQVQARAFERRMLPALVLAWCAFHVLMPFRFLLYPNHVLWGEQGMRFSWRVMNREKSGSVTFLVRSKETGREWQVNPAESLTPRQVREMATQPDLILQAAHHVARDFARNGLGAVEVRADTKVSLNGRRAVPLVDPTVDLVTIRDGVSVAGWILPPPSEPPLRRGPALWGAR